MTDFTQSDVSTEAFREYRYGNGDVYRIDAPKALWRKETPSGDSHRVIDAEGRTHCPRKGWVAIVWSAPDQPVSF